MSGRAWILVAAGAVIAAGALVGVQSGATVGDGSVGFEIDVLRAEGPPDAYRVEAVYRDLATGDVLAAPTLVFLEDQEARTESRIGETGQISELSVRVGEGGESVSYEMVLREDGRVIGKHRATLEVGG